MAGHLLLTTTTTSSPPPPPPPPPRLWPSCPQAACGRPHACYSHPPRLAASSQQPTRELESTARAAHPCLCLGPSPSPSLCSCRRAAALEQRRRRGACTRCGDVCSAGTAAASDDAARRGLALCAAACTTHTRVGAPQASRSRRIRGSAERCKARPRRSRPPRIRAPPTPSRAPIVPRACQRQRCVGLRLWLWLGICFVAGGRAAASAEPRSIPSAASGPRHACAPACVTAWCGGRGPDGGRCGERGAGRLADVP